MLHRAKEEQRHRCCCSGRGRSWSGSTRYVKGRLNVSNFEKQSKPAVSFAHALAWRFCRSDARSRSFYGRIRNRRLYDQPHLHGALMGPLQATCHAVALTNPLIAFTSKSDHHPASEHCSSRTQTNQLGELVMMRAGDDQPFRT